VIEPHTWTQRHIYLDFYSGHIAFSSSGDTLVCADGTSVQSICTKTGQQLFSPWLDMEEDFVIESIAFLDHSVPIASTNSGKDVAVKDMETWKTLVKFENCKGTCTKGTNSSNSTFGDLDPGSSTLSPDGQFIAIGGTGSQFGSCSTKTDPRRSSVCAVRTAASSVAPFLGTTKHWLFALARSTLERFVWTYMICLRKTAF
jgi:hypothetical protein